MLEIEKADRKVTVRVNGIDKTAVYSFKCSECKKIKRCDNVSKCSHIAYISDRAPVGVQSVFVDAKKREVSVPACDATEFAKICQVVERTHRIRMMPYVEMNVKIK